MRKSALVFIAVFSFNGVAEAEALNAEDYFKIIQKELAGYYSCVQAYAKKYSSTKAQPSDIAVAALSACQEFHRRYVDASLSFLGNSARAEQLGEIARENAKGFSVQTVVEQRAGQQ